MPPSHLSSKGSSVRKPTHRVAKRPAKGGFLVLGAWAAPGAGSRQTGQTGRVATGDGDLDFLPS